MNHDIVDNLLWPFKVISGRLEGLLYYAECDLLPIAKLLVINAKVRYGRLRKVIETGTNRKPFNATSY